MIEEFCLELNTYLQYKFSLAKPPAYHNPNNTICAQRRKFDLYFRYKPGNEKTLVIARIEFQEQRKGNGTMLLKFISEISGKHDIETISLECVNENSYNFGIKMGFADVGNNAMKIFTKDLVRNMNLLHLSWN